MTKSVCVEHIAFWTADLERLSNFWKDVFGASVSSLYASSTRPGFQSRFISLGEGARIELMTAPWIRCAEEPHREVAGVTHLAVSLGSAEAVDALAIAMAEKGCLASPPRLTGDGYYEAVISDPDGNAIEIIA